MAIDVEDADGFYILPNLQGSQTHLRCSAYRGKFYILPNLQGSQTLTTSIRWSTGFISFLTYKVLKQRWLRRIQNEVFYILPNLQGSQTAINKPLADLGFISFLTYKVLKQFNGNAQINASFISFLTYKVLKLMSSRKHSISCFISFLTYKVLKHKILLQRLRGVLYPS